MILADSLTSILPSIGDSFYTILTVLLAHVAQWAYTRFESRRIKKALREKEEKDKKARIRIAKRQARLNRTSKESLQVNNENKASMNEIKESLNGKGLGGQMSILIHSLEDIVGWQDTHEKNDLERHEELTKKHEELVKKISSYSEMLSRLLTHPLLAEGVKVPTPEPKEN